MKKIVYQFCFLILNLIFFCVSVVIFLFFTNLSTDALGAKLAIPSRVSAGTAFFTLTLVVLLANCNGLSVWMVEAIHIPSSESNSDSNRCRSS